MTQAILWYLIITLTGAAAFPLVYRLFPALTSRGYAIARSFGLLVWGYLFWLLSSLGILANTAGGYLFAFALLAGAAIWAWRKIDRAEITGWLREKRRFLLTTEVLFLLAYLFLLLMRGMEPGAIATEKPMELAFLNAVLRSPQMPPLDPWLSGYAISYYYFGYVLMGMLAKLSGSSAGMAFNLGISLVFALSAVGAYGIVYDLLAALPDRKREHASLPLLGPLFLLLVSNVEGFLEILHGLGVGWQQSAAGEWSSKFWSWVNLENLSSPPPGNTVLGEQRFWWWWRASRVVADFDLNGIFNEVIDEFPFFSYYLADLHPHVLVMPFVLLALAFSLHMFLRKSYEGKPFRLFNLTYDFPRSDFLLGVVIFGGLGFLNLWDFPWQVVVFAGAHLLRKARQEGWSTHRLTEFGALVGAFGIGGALVYLPFYLSFSSQAGGILPNVINPTRGIHLWIMFGTLFIPLFLYLIFLARRKGPQSGLFRGLILSLSVVLGLFVFSLLFTYALGNPRLLVNGTNPFLGIYGAENVRQLFDLGISRRMAAIGSAITLIALFGLAAGVLWPAKEDHTLEPAPAETLPKSHRFAVLLIVVGSLLVIVPEFIYLRDFFGKRMNTVFKFYYQGWILWSMAAAFASAAILTSDRAGKAFRNIYRIILSGVVFIGLCYTVMGINTRIATFQSQGEPALELDGAANYSYLNFDEQAAAAWLRQAPLGVLAEAPHPDPFGGSYTHYARISMNTGQPAVLGWVGHERQWRGGTDEVGTRYADLVRLYESPDWQETQAVIEQYQIVYIVVGNLEETTYNVYNGKFIQNLTPVFQQGSVTIYQTNQPTQ